MMTYRKQCQVMSIVVHLASSQSTPSKVAIWNREPEKFTHLVPYIPRQNHSSCQTMKVLSVLSSLVHGWISMSCQCYSVYAS